MPYLIRNPDTSNKAIYELKTGSTMIGRGMENGLPLEEHEKSVSRRHAEIYVSDTGITITDQGSLNSTFVNEVKVKQTSLKHGDLVRCGDVVFQFVQTLNPLDVPEIPQFQEKERDSNLPILRRFSLEETQTAMQDLLHQERLQTGSVLKLRHADVFQRTVDKLKILLEVSKRLSSPEQFDRLLENILNVLFQIMDIDRAVILLVSEVTGELEPKATKSRAGIPTDAQFYSKQIANFVLRNGDAVLVDDARLDERFDSSESIVNQAIHASIGVPLTSRSTVIGVLYVDNLSLGSLYSQEDLEFLTALANQAAIAIEDANLYKKAQAEAALLAKLERFFPKAVSKKIKEGEALDVVDTEVTALFSDISRFTEISSCMEPRQVIEMLNEYFKVMVEDIVFPYEGTLEKYIGDALLAIWGAPYPHPDDACRAVRAAIDMQWAARRLNQHWKERRNLEIQIHIGINTGKVAAGNIGSDQLIQYAAIGDTTNVTSRICSAAQAGEILISQITFEKLGERCPPVENLSPVMVKGKAQPLQLYRVLWEHMQPAGLHG